MKTIYKNLKVVFLLAVALLMNVNVFATTYTAIASGNYNASATWAGGTVPPVTIASGDKVAIAGLYNITLNQNVILSSGAELEVFGKLTGANKEYIDVKDGAKITGTGTVAVDSMGIHTYHVNLNGLEFGGNITVDYLSVSSALLNIVNNIDVNKALHVKGFLEIMSGFLHLGSGADIYIYTGSLQQMGTGVLDFSTVYNVHYLGQQIFTSGPELTGVGLHDVTIDIGFGSSVILTGDLTMAGKLSIPSGALSLSGYNLYLGGDADVSIGATSGISSTSSSEIQIISQNGLTGSLKFFATNEVGRLIIQLGNGGDVPISTDVVVTDTLKLQNGNLVLDNCKLDIKTGAGVAGGSQSSYITAMGNSRVAMDVLTGNTKTFHVGADNNRYAPVTIKSASGSGSSRFSVGVSDGVLESGTTGADISAAQPVVNVTWMIESSASSNIDVDLEMMWSAAMEVNSFDRSKANIAHYTGGKWDVGTNSAAMSNGSMYSLSRTGVKSFSPFAVFDENTAVSVATVANDADITLYPNPATGILHINMTGIAEDVQADVYNVRGQVVYSTTVSNGDNVVDITNLASGSYYLQLSSDRLKTVRPFVVE